MRNIVILNSLHFSYPLPILMRVSYNTLIVKQNTSDYYKYNKKEREMVIYFLKNYSSVICFTLICCFRKVEADSENFSSASVV